MGNFCWTKLTTYLRLDMLVSLFVSVCVLLSAPVAVATSVSYTGYLVDNFCWNMDNNTGVDKTNLGVEPERHYLHCLVLPQCKASGYSFLEASDSTPPTYTRKYTLDMAGNSKAVTFFTEEHAKGDRRFNDKVTATGHVVDGVLQVQTLALASSSVPDPRTDTSSALKVSSNAVGFLLATGLSAALF